MSMKTLLAIQTTNGSKYDPQTEVHTPVHHYEVDKVTNSITPPIHSRLTADQMAVYCDSDEWNVTIK